MVAKLKPLPPKPPSVPTKDLSKSRNQSTSTSERTTPTESHSVAENLVPDVDETFLNPMGREPVTSHSPKPSTTSATPSQPSPNSDTERVLAASNPTAQKSRPHTLFASGPPTLPNAPQADGTISTPIPPRPFANGSLPRPPMAPLRPPTQGGVFPPMPMSGPSSWQGQPQQPGQAMPPPSMPPPPFQQFRPPPPNMPPPRSQLAPLAFTRPPPPPTGMSIPQPVWQPPPPPQQLVGRPPSMPQMSMPPPPPSHAPPPPPSS